MALTNIQRVYRKTLKNVNSDSTRQEGQIIELPHTWVKLMVKMA